MKEDSKRCCDTTTPESIHTKDIVFIIIWCAIEEINLQRWKQTRFRVCFHLWCELTSTIYVTEWLVSWNSCHVFMFVFCLDDVKKLANQPFNISCQYDKSVSTPPHLEYKVGKGKYGNVTGVRYIVDESAKRVTAIFQGLPPRTDRTVWWSNWVRFKIKTTHK